jgi:DNA-binding phage protein
MDEEKVTFSEWSLTDQIETKEDVAGTIEAAIELAVQENDPEYLLKAVGDAARSIGLTFYISICIKTPLHRCRLLLKNRAIINHTLLNRVHQGKL